MKRIFKNAALVACVLAMLFSSVVTLIAANGIAIDPSNFPDDNFRAYVQILDTNKDGSLSASECSSVKRIAVTGSSISDLTGIEHFPNLEQLFCAQNTLKKIDVSKNTKLQALNVSLNSKLGAIDVSANRDLYWFACAKAGLRTLNVRNNTALTCLSCGDNDLTSLDISRNRLLEELYIESNPIEVIDLSNNPNLNRFTFASTALTSLDLSNQSGDIILNDTDMRYPCSYESGTFSLDTLPGDFDVNKTSNWVNAKRNGTVLTVVPNVVKVTYDYDCGNGQTVTFALISKSFLDAGGNLAEIPEGVYEPEEAWVNPYSDIPDTHPNIDAITHVTKRGVFQGTDKDDPKFSPEMKLTRAQLVTIFGRLAGVDVTKYQTSSFTDVDPKKSSHAWFAPYVAWANEEGLVLGYGDGKFGPTDDLTVEQTLVFLARYARFEGKSTDSAANLEIYKDAKDVSSWAKKDVQWALATGTYFATNGKLEPKKITDRLLTAIFIHHYDTMIP